MTEAKINRESLTGLKENTSTKYDDVRIVVTGQRMWNGRGSTGSLVKRPLVLRPINSEGFEA